MKMCNIRATIYHSSSKLGWQTGFWRCHNPINTYTYKLSQN